MQRQEKCDVIVVGGGSAAFAAAVQARLSGASKVVVLEKAPEDNAGGNPRFSVSGFRFVHKGAEELRQFLPDIPEDEWRNMNLPPYTEDDFRRDLLRMTQGRINRDLMEVLVTQSNEALHWLLELGHKWQPMTLTVIDGVTYFGAGHNITPLGGGLGLLGRYREIAQELGGIEIRYRSPVIGLHGNFRRVDGVRVCGPEGEYDLLAPSTILCSGGFQASPQMRARYLGPGADLVKVRGSRYNTGEVLMMAVELGAKTAGQWQMAHGSPVTRDIPDVEVGDHHNKYSYVLGITVNQDGLRFFDEGEDESTYTYAKTGWKITAQPGGIAYQLFDQKMVRYMRSNYQLVEPVVADTWEEMAEKLGMNPVVLKHTVEEFNKAVRDDVPFSFPRPDGKSTVGLAIPKSNWALRLDEPPFLAYPVTGGITFTFGGLAINTEAQVLNTSDEVIEGLYASGDILGLFYHNYPSCTGQTRNVVFGRIAGRNAANRAG